MRLPLTVRRALTGAAVTICAAAPFAVVTASASAKSPNGKGPKATGVSVVTPGSGYLALGDSVTFGYEESAVVPAPNYKDASGFLGYPEMLASDLHLKVANAACPGETSASLINASAQSNGCENTPGNSTAGYRREFPLHVSYTGSQLAFALSYLHSHRNVGLVSLMIGANDAFVCQETTADKCGSGGEQKTLFATISRNVRTILLAIRNKAHYRGQLAIVNYYSLDYASAATNAQSTALNTSMDTAAKPFHVVIADGFGEWQAASVHSAGNPCTAGLLTQLSTGGCGIHPSYAGQTLLAQSLEKVIRFR